jgi:microtubule-associated protein-like 1/2
VFHVCFSATNTISKFLRGLHEGSVFSVCVMKEGNLVTGGGKDGRLVQLDASLNPTGQESCVPEHLGMLSLIVVYVTLWEEH